MAKQYIQLYYSYLDAIEPLSDAERGRLFTSLLEYSKTGATQELCGNERFIYPMMKAQVDRDNEAYNDKCRKNSDNRKQLKTVVDENDDCQRPLTNATKKKEKEKEKEKEKKKENNITHSCSAAPNEREFQEQFDRLWAIFPKKQGKAKAFAEFKKAVKANTTVEQIENGIKGYNNYIKYNNIEPQYIKNGDNWFKGKCWLNDYSIINTPVSKTSPRNKFVNYEQRNDYDFDDLERQDAAYLQQLSQQSEDDL